MPVSWRKNVNTLLATLASKLLVRVLFRFARYNTLLATLASKLLVRVL